MKLFYKLAYSILVSCIIVPAVASADQFDDAVNEYIKGYKACTEANTLRAQNLQSAKRKFDTYLKYLASATAMDPSILTTTQRDMDSNLRYCERVEINIKRAEATPILEKGFVYCDQAKEALKNGDARAAKTNLDEYNRHRDDAMIITESIMDVFALASKVRSCARLEEKLAAALEKENALIATINLAIAGYKDVNKNCEAAKKSITSPTFSLNRLDSVNAQMNEANKAKKEARKHSEAFATLETQPQRAESIELQKLIDSATTCEGVTSEHIRTATKSKRTLEKDIDRGINNLASSQQACESAKSKSSVLTSGADIAAAEAEYKKSAELKRKVTSDKNLISMVRKYPSWGSSQKFSKLMTSTEACQTAAAANIKKQKSVVASQQQKASQEAARQKQLEEERKRLAEEKASKQAAESKRLAEQKRQQELARKKAEEEAKQAATLSDVEEDFVEGDDFGDFGDFGGDDDDNGKSWTDLVR